MNPLMKYKNREEKTMNVLKNEKGFTLIELVLIIIVLGILSAVAIVQFGTLSTSARDAAIDGVFGSLQSQLAITVGECRTYPTEAAGDGDVCDASASDFTGDFGSSIRDRVNSGLSGDVSMSAYTAGTDDDPANGTVVICSGDANGRKATATYTVTSGVGSLTIGAKGTGASPCA
jgi:type II secretory pathway pseudopilin PulG